MRVWSILLAGLVSSLMAFDSRAQTPADPLRDPNIAAPSVLPAGHPDLPGMAPASQPSSHGSISIHGIQGTKDAPSIASQTIAVELYHQERLIRKVGVKLDDKGAATLSGLPLSLPFKPQLSMVYQRITYRASGGIMDSTHPSQHIDLTVYETTEQPPPWHLHMRHVIVAPSPQGLKVTEVLALNNPSDRTWIGTADAAGGRTTLVMPMPPGLVQLELGGSLRQHVKMRDGKLVSTQPMQPGAGQLQLSYLIPGTGGQAKLTVTAPSPIKRMAIFTPAEGTKVTVTGLENGGVHQAETAKMQTYKGADLAAGHETVLTAILPAAAIVTASASSDVPKIIAGVGMLILLVGGVVVVLIKSPKTAAKSKKKR